MRALLLIDSRWKLHESLESSVNMGTGVWQIESHLSTFHLRFLVNIMDWVLRTTVVR